MWDEVVGDLQELLVDLLILPTVVVTGTDIDWSKTIKKNTNSTPNKSQTKRAKAYKVTSFLNTDCELSTNPCSRFLHSLGPLCFQLCQIHCNTTKDGKDGDEDDQVDVWCFPGRKTTQH